MRIACAAMIGATIVLCETLPAATIIHAGRLIDGRSDELQTEMSIVIEDGKITEVVKGFINPADGDRLIDLSQLTVMPGLMDMHTHLIGQHSKEAYTEKFFNSKRKQVISNVNDECPKPPKRSETQARRPLF